MTSSSSSTASAPGVDVTGALASAGRGAAAGFPRSDTVGAIIQLALAEDVGRGDITTEATVAAETQATAEILQKQAGVICGLPVVEVLLGKEAVRTRHDGFPPSEVSPEYPVLSPYIPR